MLPLFLPCGRFFSVDADDGQIRTTSALDTEKTPVISLMVTASDNAADRRKSTVNVTVYVEDVEDVTPMFTQNLYMAQAPENEVNYMVTTVEVSSGDREKYIKFTTVFEIHQSGAACKSDIIIQVNTNYLPHVRRCQKTDVVTKSTKV